MEYKFNLSTIFENIDACIESYLAIEDEVILYISYAKNITTLEEAKKEIEYVNVLLSKLETVGKYVLLYEVEMGQISNNINMMRKDSYIKFFALKQSLKRNLNISKEDLDTLSKSYPNFVNEIAILEEFEQTLNVTEAFGKLLNSTKDKEVAHDTLKYVVYKYYEYYNSYAKKFKFSNSLKYTEHAYGINEKQIRNILNISKIRSINSKLIDFLENIFSYKANNLLDVDALVYSLDEQNKKAKISISKQLDILYKLSSEVLGEDITNIMKQAAENGSLKIGGIIKKVPDENGDIVEIESNTSDGYVISMPNRSAMIYLDRNESSYGMHIIVHEFGHLLKENSMMYKIKSIEKTDFYLLEEIPAIVNQLLLLEANVSIGNTNIEAMLITNFLTYVYRNLIEITPLIYTEIDLMKGKQTDLDCLYAFNLDKINEGIIPKDESIEYEKLWVKNSALTNKLMSLKYVLGIVIAPVIVIRLLVEEDYIYKYKNFLELENLTDPVKALKETLDIDIENPAIINAGYEYLERLICSLEIL